METANLGPNRISFLLSSEETGGRYSLTEFMRERLQPAWERASVRTSRLEVWRGQEIRA